jgi:hypothetical protein
MQLKFLRSIQIFLWRAAQHGLPIGENWAIRLRLQISPCAMCGQVTEIIIYVLFFYNFAPAVWLVSPLELRVHNLPDYFRNLMDCMEGQMFMYL